LSTEGNSAAVAGIEAGEVVSTSSFDKLQDGAKVTVQNTAPASPAAVPGPGANTNTGKTS
jgi:multidrug efflux system membrane fusion protein